MDETTILDDPIGTLEEEDTSSGKFELSEGGYYEKYIPGDDEREQLHDYVFSYIKALEEDNAPILREVAENIDAYRGKTRTIGTNADEDPVLTLPLIGRKIDQLVAFEVLTLLRPRPLITIDPYSDESYEVMLSTPQEIPGMGMMPLQMTEERSSEDIAATLELGVDYKLREKMPFPKIVKKVSMDLKVANYSVLKTVYDTKTISYRQPRLERLPGGFVRVDGTEDHIMRGRDAARIYNVGLFGFLAPVDCDLEDAELVCELTPLTQTDMREGLSSRAFWYPPKDEKSYKTLINSTTDDFRLTQDPERTIKQASSTRRHDVREVWFSWAPEVTEYDEEGTSYKVRNRMSMCGLFHMGTKQFLTLYRNPYHHGQHPYDLVTEDEESRRRPEISMVGRVRVHQTLASQALHTDMANAYQASNFDLLVNPDSDAWKAVSTYGRKPGRLIPVYDENDYQVVQAGSNHPGLGQIIGFIINDATQTLGVDPLEEGAFVPGLGRTPADTVRQVMESGVQRPLMTLMAMSEGIGRAVRKYLRVLKQFEPYGELIPTRNPETQARMMVPFRHPVEEVLDGFRIALTAADEELAKEADEQQRIMMFNMIRDYSATAVQIAGPIVNPALSPAMKGIYLEMLNSVNRAMKLVIEPIRKDADKFLISDKAIEAVTQEAQFFAMQAMQQMGGMGNGAAPGVSGPVPGGPGGGGPMGQMAGPAGNAGGPPPPPA